MDDHRALVCDRDYEPGQRSGSIVRFCSMQGSKTPLEPCYRIRMLARGRFYSFLSLRWWYVASISDSYVTIDHGLLPIC